MPAYRLKSAFLQQGWMRDVLVTVSNDGVITAIEQASTARPGASDAQAVNGVVVPGMSNAHSHAFQRAMAGVSEFRSSARDSFWTWREAMYALANRVTPSDLQIIATQLFIEMLKAGYTSVAEFHYLHRAVDGSAYPDTNEMWRAVDTAAQVAGIGLTLLPTLYQTSDFGAKPLRADQARFNMDLDSFLRGIQEWIASPTRQNSNRRRIGAAFHSLRAVPLAVIKECSQALKAMDASMPVHIHIAEQILEVRSCLESTGRRPIELLLDQGIVTPLWCLVHATHATPSELKNIVASGASVCVSITTEANLGDGFFDSARFLAAQGRLCVGSDSQATVSASEELRWLEYQQRLRKKRRNVLGSKAQPHVGTQLWSAAARTGAQALGQGAGSIAVGSRADWLVLDADHPSMAGGALESALDRLLFAGADQAIRDVMVAGHWVIRDRRHAIEHESSLRYAQLLTAG